MRAADFCRLNVDIGVRLQFAVSGSINCSGKTNSRIAGGFQLLDVLWRIRGVTDDKQQLPGLNLLKRLNHDVGIVLRLEAAHIKKVAARMDAELVQDARGGGAIAMRTIRDHDGPRTVLRQIIFT